MDTIDYWQGLFLIVLIGASAFFSASEIGPDNIDAADPIATMNENWGEFDSTARLLSASHDMLAALESARSAMSAIVAKTDEQKEAFEQMKKERPQRKRS